MKVKLILPAPVEAERPARRPIECALFPPLGPAALAAFLADFRLGRPRARHASPERTPLGVPPIRRDLVRRERYLVPSSIVVSVGADAERAARRLDELRIVVDASFVFGLDGDRADVFDRTVDRAVGRGVTTSAFHIATPRPGTSLHDDMRAAGRLLHRAHGAAKRLACAAGRKRLGSMWNLVIRARRLAPMTPLPEGVPSRASRTGSAGRASATGRTGGAGRHGDAGRGAGARSGAPGASTGAVHRPAPPIAPVARVGAARWTGPAPR